MYGLPGFGHVFLKFLSNQLDCFLKLLALIN